MNDMLNLFGLVGTLFLAFSGLPQAIKSVKEKHSDGIAHGTILLWFFGEIIIFFYTIIKYTNDYVLLINYFSNVVIVGVIFYYKYRKFFGKLKEIIKWGEF